MNSNLYTIRYYANHPVQNIEGIHRDLIQYFDFMRDGKFLPEDKFLILRDQSFIAKCSGKRAAIAFIKTLSVPGFYGIFAYRKGCLTLNKEGSQLAQKYKITYINMTQPHKLIIDRQNNKTYIESIEPQEGLNPLRVDVIAHFSSSEWDNPIGSYVVKERLLTQ